MNQCDRLFIGIFFILLSLIVLGSHIFIAENIKETRKLKDKMEKIEKNQLQSPTSVVD
jgi:hypothetical protein